MSRFTFRGWRVSRFIFVALLLTLACSSAAHADTWSSGQVITYTQNEWGAGGSATSILSENFLSVYPTGIVFVGEASGGFAMVFDNAGSISAYLPASGAAGPLDANLLDPTSTASGTFGGDVLALQLDVDFSDAGVTLGSSGVPFGDLIIENDLAGEPSLNGLTVRQVLADANMDLGGGNSGYTIDQLDPVVGSLSISFDGGVPDIVAQDYLVAPTSVVPTPEPSSVLLLGVALLGLGAVQYKRRASARSMAA